MHRFAVLALVQLATCSSSSKPHIISILQDDLGYYDSGIHNPDAAAWTGNITAMAKAGIVLTHHYTHWHCSPTRRSFLTGRLPIHHGEQLSGNAGDDIDLRMTWVSEKLKSQGYKTHWFGKMHTGFRSFNHLGFRKGFDTNVGSLQTGSAYSGPKHSTRWQNDHPIWKDAQFSDMPEQCGNVMHSSAPTCTTSILNDTILPCGNGYRFLKTASWEDCCTECSNDDKCTHWVYNADTDGNKPPCHIKSGQHSCSSAGKGSVSGTKGGPAPGPSPPSGGAKCVNEYSTDLWGQLAVQALQDHDAKDPLYIHLCFQAVHTPYDKAPGDPTGNVYKGMLWRADVYIGQLMSLLKAKGMWDNTLIVYSADNGGVGQGNNYPLRGEKHSNWEGAMRTAAFVSGGLIPQKLRGTQNAANMHIVDWHPTFATLAGADASDDPPVMPKSTDPANPHKDIYGDSSFPPLDGVNVWPALMNSQNSSPNDAHEYLVLTKEVILSGQYKLLVSQPYFKSQNSGWKQPDGTWKKMNADDWPCSFQDVSPKDSALPVPHPGKTPCLFDIRADPGEHVNIAKKNPDIVQKLWAELNATILTQRDCNGWTYEPIPGPSGTCSPAKLLGKCDSTCAKKKWAKYGSNDGPVCGVPGCDGEEEVVV